MNRTFKNMRTGQIATVKRAIAAGIIAALDTKLWDKIEVIGADYHYVVTMQGNKLRLRTVYQEPKRKG